ncbi:L-fucose mutarotase/ribose pyranase (RbsD/FucU family) [Bradyrhizobium liaoningense]
MLKSIDPILTPDLLWLLASMGHGDDLVFVDANHPATRIAQSTSSQRLIQLPGMSMEVAIRAIMSVYPLDDFDADPVRVMMPVDDPDRVPDVQRAVLAEIARAAGHPVTPGKLSRADFYRAAAGRLWRRAGRRQQGLWLLPAPQGCDQLAGPRSIDARLGAKRMRSSCAMIPRMATFIQHSNLNGVLAADCLESTHVAPCVSICCHHPISAAGRRAR